jgi:hypothetical protein
MRRLPLAFVLLAVLSLLAAGAAILGVFQAPTSTDLAVHNGAGETLEASPVVGFYTTTNLVGEYVTFVFTLPDRAVEEAKTKNGTVKGKRTVEGATATGVLQPVRALLSLHRFKAHDGEYRIVEPVADLVPAYERSAVSGVYTAVVHMAGGYVVEVDYSINAEEAGQHVSQSLRFLLTQVGSWKRP